MAFDGITIAAIRSELEQSVVGGKINKIAQPEPDELILTIKNNRKVYRLLLSASASLPLIYLTQTNKTGPMTAPNFCMLLRKHIGSGKILSVTQPSLERVLIFEIEHLNELGDICRKKLIVEIMGKHSNIIFCNENDDIIDSIKHISANMSSVREVLPGRPYFIPQTQEKEDPYTIGEQEFYGILKKPFSCAKSLYMSLTGISPVMAEEICFRSGIDGGRPFDAMDDTASLHLYHIFSRLMEELTAQTFQPSVYYDGKEPMEFSAVLLLQFQDYTCCSYASISEVLEQYYALKNQLTRIRQKSADLRRVVQTALERNVKKLNLQTRQMKDTEKKDKYRIYGELLNTYGYNVTPGYKSMEALNYYTNDMITIPLDDTLTPTENAKKYFDRYGKLKRTADALETQLQETQQDIVYLESISAALDIALEEEDLVQIKEELVASGYIRRKGTPGGKKVKCTSRPFHYRSSDGFDIYVGKNNLQNEELSFKLATGNDWWFHSKGCPGSHVIVKCPPDGSLPDRTFEEAGRLAAYYSSARLAPKVEIDYTQKKNLRKPGGAKPGFVVYYTNYSMLIAPDISDIEQL